MSEEVEEILVFLGRISEFGANAAEGRDRFLRESLSHLEAKQGRQLHLNDEGDLPRLGDSEGILSLSHTRHWIGLAYAPTSRVGLDLEEKRRHLLHPDAILRRFFSEKDVEALGTAPQTEDLLRLWTRKEALLKAEGRGLHEEIGERGHLALEEAALRWQMLDLAAAYADFPAELLGSVACAPSTEIAELIRVRRPRER